MAASVSTSRLPWIDAPSGNGGCSSGCLAGCVGLMMQRRTNGVRAIAGSSNSLHASIQPSGSACGQGLHASAQRCKKSFSPSELAFSAACLSCCCCSSTSASARRLSSSASAGAASRSM
eukprot:1850177-Prymnesium_polylepis.2